MAMIEVKTPQSLEELISLIKEKQSILLLGARTSTVIPFSNENILEKALGQTVCVDLQAMPSEIKLLSGSDSKSTQKEVYIKGAVSWSELRAYLRALGQDVLCWPTDESAFVLSGIASAATGERFFSSAGVRESVQWLSVIHADGQIKEYHASNEINHIEYQCEQQKYEGFKNAPYPFLKNETDYFIGSEGQLGVIIEARLKVTSYKESSYYLLPIQSWLESDELIKYQQLVQAYRKDFLSVEFFDSQCLNFVKDETLKKDCDYLIIEASEPDVVIEAFGQKSEEFIVLNRDQFMKLRVSIPRSINEYLSKNSLVKKGTDAQVRVEQFGQLIDKYRSWKDSNIEFLLFGHLGDSHLHFNFLLDDSDSKKCDKLLDDFYTFLADIEASPFAEHGIGLIKQKFIKNFYSSAITDVFKELKDKYDPQRKLFPQGFMRINGKS